MKKLTIISLSVLLLLALSACTNKPPKKDSEKQQKSTKKEVSIAKSKEENLSQDTLLSREQAIEIALTNAGFTEDAVYDLETELDKEYRVTIWEVDFSTGSQEYSYDINAATGEIINVKQEAWD